MGEVDRVVDEGDKTKPNVVAAVFPDNGVISDVGVADLK